MTKTIAIQTASRQDLPVLRDMMEALKAVRDVDYYERCLELQEDGKRLIFIAKYASQPVGYCILNWQPKYQAFQRLGIPEIQDLNILPDFRQQGFARRMIAHCEDLARARGIKMMGIGVGLHASFGPAQRLYIALGYQPDGQGISYDRQPISAGDLRPVDDELCLMMLKDL